MLCRWMSAEITVKEALMKLKGTMVIELTDTNTRDVETITEENMVTNVVNHLLGINPMAAMYNAAGEYDV